MNAPVSALSVRDATEADAEAIALIYNHAVVNTTAIWNETQVDAPNRVQWMQARHALGYPVLVAELGGQVLGYASFGDWRAFDGYRHTVEHSVYVHPLARRQGVAQALMRELVERARRLDKHVMVAAIEAGNAASLALHARLGFEDCGTLREVGVKFGRWLDLTWMALRLDDQPAPPKH